MMKLHLGGHLAYFEIKQRALLEFALATPTRLKRMNNTLQERLINWGYAVCDAAMRKHVDTSLPKGKFPYPNSGV